jgi:DNA-binding MarR family transcriptional regulator
MADIKAHPNPLFLRDDELRQGIEMLFFAYRGFTAQADAALAELDLGRAHHRAIYFVGRHPGMTVGDLLGILRVTKQSLSRVLSQLVAQGLVVQKRDARDARKRQLSLTARGAELERRLTAEQRALIARAYRDAGAEAVAGFRKVLLGLIEDGDRDRFRPGSAAAATR